MESSTIYQEILAVSWLSSTTKILCKHYDGCSLSTFSVLAQPSQDVQEAIHSEKGKHGLTVTSTIVLMYVLTLDHGSLSHNIIRTTPTAASQISPEIFIMRATNAPSSLHKPLHFHFDKIFEVINFHGWPSQQKFKSVKFFHTKTW